MSIQQTIADDNSYWISMLCINVVFWHGKYLNEVTLLVPKLLRWIQSKNYRCISAYLLSLWNTHTHRKKNAAGTEQFLLSGCPFCLSHVGFVVANHVKHSFHGHRSLWLRWNTCRLLNIYYILWSYTPQVWYVSLCRII